MAGLVKEIWRKEILGGLYKNNDFLNYCKDASGDVKDGTIVHISQAGAGSNIEVNRTSLPATITEREDSDITYALKEFTSDPKLVRNLDKIQYEYDKVQSILEEDMATMRQKVADWMLRLWAPADAGRFIRTSGANTAATAPGATGTRKLFTLADLLQARLKMNLESVPDEDRYAIIPSNLMMGLLDDPVLKARDKSLELDMKGGVISRIYGFNLIERPSAVIYDASGTPVAKNPGVAGATTDNHGVICWQKFAVEKAIGAIKPFYNLGKAEYFGDIFSFLVMAGGRIRREDNKGIVSIIEAAGA